MQVSIAQTTFATPACTLVTEGDAALTVVIAVGTTPATDRVCPGAVVLTGLQMRLTTVRVTHLLTARVVGLVERVVRTVTVRLAALRVTARATGVLGGPNVEALTAVVRTNLSVSTATALGVEHTLVAASVLASHTVRTDLGGDVLVTGRVTGLHITAGATLGVRVTQTTRATRRGRHRANGVASALTGVVSVSVTEATSCRPVGVTHAAVAESVSGATVRTGHHVRPGVSAASADAGL